jgi:hypothetical protein
VEGVVVDDVGGEGAALKVVGAGRAAVGGDDELAEGADGIAAAELVKRA